MKCSICGGRIQPGDYTVQHDVWRLAHYDCWLNRYGV